MLDVKHSVRAIADVIAGTQGWGAGVEGWSLRGATRAEVRGTSGARITKTRWVSSRGRCTSIGAGADLPSRVCLALL